MHILLVLWLLSLQTAALQDLQQDVQVKLGEVVTLHCQISKNETISVLKWSRPDLNTDGYVYFYRNRRFYENYQHPSFHGRVKLRNPEMKDGDVSLILENVTFNDTGIYECHIAVKNPGSSKRAHTEISHFINLTVTGSDSNYNYDLSGQALTGLYNSPVQRAELMNRPLQIKVRSLVGTIQWGPISHSGVRVTLDDGSQWLIHKGAGFGILSQTVVTDARHMSSAWKVVREKEFHGSKTVSDFVGAGGPNYNLICDNCHLGAERMMEQ